MEQAPKDSTASTILSTTLRGKHSPLEALPAELQAAVLECLPDIQTLYSLIRASPSYHQSYLAQRQKILFAVLLTDMTLSVLHEARFVFQAAEIRRGDSENTWIPEVESFLHDYKTNREVKDDRPLLSEPLDLESIISLAQLHWSVMDIANDFHCSALCQHPMSGQDLEYEELSTNERRRIYRAFYRFEIFSYLFANLIWSPLYTLDWGSQVGSQAGTLFFPGFELWEIEEIFCIRDYIYRAYDKIFKDCEEELFNLFFREEESDGFPTQTEKDILARMKERTWSDYSDLTEALMSQGLEFLSRIMNFSSSRDKVYLIEDQVGRRLGFGDHSAFLTNALEGHEMIRLPNTREEAQQLADVHFSGDSQEDSPNAAWPWSIRLLNNEPHFRTSFAGKEFFRSWGYVIWDSARLDGLKVMDNAASTYQAHGPKARDGPLLSDWAKR